MITSGWTPNAFKNEETALPALPDPDILSKTAPNDSPSNEKPNAI